MFISLHQSTHPVIEIFVFEFEENIKIELSVPGLYLFQILFW
jgi:hypothetical protein